MSTKIFVLGATGYVGGSILSHLQSSSSSSAYSFSALVRDDKRAETLRSLKVEPVIGSFSDLPLLTAAAANADIVVNSFSDDLPATQALIKGLKQRGGKRGPAYLIQVSGTGVLCDHARGENDAQIPFDDLDVSRISQLPDEQPHKNVDDYLFSCNDQPDVLRTIITCPPLIYGKGLGHFNRRSQQIPAIINAVLRTHKNGRLGAGLNRWGVVHVADVAEFYRLLVDAAVAGKASYGEDGFYFAEAGEETVGDMCRQVYDAVAKRKGWESKRQEEFTEEEVGKYFNGEVGWWIFGGNSRSRATRARKELGWEAREQGLRDSLEEEVEYRVGKEGGLAGVEVGVDA